MKQKHPETDFDLNVDNLLLALMASEVVSEWEYEKNTQKYKKIKIYCPEEYNDPDTFLAHLVNQPDYSKLENDYTFLPQSSKIAAIKGFGKAKYFCLEISKNKKELTHNNNNNSSKIVMENLNFPMGSSFFNEIELNDYAKKSGFTRIQKDNNDPGFFLMEQKPEKRNNIIIKENPPAVKSNSGFFANLLRNKSIEKVEPLGENEFFLCPITRKKMRDPVLVVYNKHGHTYEREALVNWVQQHRTLPLTGEKIPSNIKILEKEFFSPNYGLKEVIDNLPKGFSI